MWLHCARAEKDTVMYSQVSQYHHCTHEWGFKVHAQPQTHIILVRLFFLVSGQYFCGHETGLPTYYSKCRSSVGRNPINTLTKCKEGPLLILRLNFVSRLIDPWESAGNQKQKYTNVLLLSQKPDAVKQWPYTTLNLQCS